MLKEIEDLTIEELNSEILSHCISNSVSAREVLQAIKSPSTSTIEEQVTNPVLRMLLKEWLLKSHSDEHAGQTLRVLIKTQLPPRTSQFMRGMTYPGNPAGLCQYIVLVWLRAQLYPPSDSPHPKRMFYEASSAMLAMSTREQWKTEWMMAMERQKLLPPDAMKPNFVWTCENILPERVFRIQPCQWRYFSRKMFELIRDLLTYHLDGFIFIFAETINHVMAATVKIREGYATFKFFDPTAPHAELAISLPLAQPEENWEKRISMFIDRAIAPSSIRISSDYTIACLCRGSSLPSLSLTNWQEVRQMPPEKVALCLHSCLKGIGGRGGYYFNYVAKLINEISLISPEYLGILSHDVTALFIAAQHGCDAVVDIILNAAHKLPPDHAQRLLQSRATDGVTALYVAAQNGHDRTVSIILNEVHRLSQELAQLLLQPRTTDGVTALFMAAQYGHDGTVSIILNAAHRLPQNLAQLLKQPMTTEGVTALYIAAQNGYDGTVSIILNEVRRLPQELAQLLQPKTDGATALFIAAQYGHDRTVSIILNEVHRLPQELAQLLLQPYNGATALYIAAENGHDRVVSMILDAVLIFICKLLPPELAQLLLQPFRTGSIALLLQPFRTGATALFIAAKNGHKRVVDIILNAVFILPPELAQYLLQPKPNGTTALVIAIQNRHERVVEKILDAIPKLPPKLTQCLLQPKTGGVDLLKVAEDCRCPQLIIARLRALKEQFKGIERDKQVL